MMRLVQMALAAGADHENTTDEGSIARKVFAPNELSAGKVFEFECLSNVLDNNSTDTLTMAVRFGSAAAAASNTACATSGAVNAEDADMCLIRGRIHVQSATRAVMTVAMSDPDAEGIAVKAYQQVLTIAPDTTYYLDVTADWSVAHEDNEVYAEAFAVFEIA